MKIWKWIKRIYDFNHSAKLSESTEAAASNESGLCEGSAQTRADTSSEAGGWVVAGREIGRERERKKNFCGLRLGTETSISESRRFNSSLLSSHRSYTEKASFSTVTPAAWE